MNIDTRVTLSQLAGSLDQMFDLAVQKVRLLETAWDPSHGAPVFTADGHYTARGWTEWTQGFQYGCAILAFDATGQKDLLELGRKQTLARMTPHVTHTGVHDHGFNNLSTYGNLRRLIREGRFEPGQWERDYYELAIKASGAVQSARWSEAQDGGGYVYSFNGPHSLFIDTMRTLRVLGVAHQLGHYLAGENDRRVNLLGRVITHGLTTARWSIFYGEGRDGYDVPRLRGRTTHEAIFNPNDGRFRCPGSQQGYSPFTTWTRGLAWAILGFAEELEFLRSLDAGEFTRAQVSDKARLLAAFEKAARATADFYIDQATAADGIPYWDTAARGLFRMGDWQSRPAEPFNEYEPVDSSAAAIAAQGLLRLGRYLGDKAGDRYAQAGLNVARILLAEPYLSTAAHHQGLLLHSTYHRPNGWDYIPPGRKIPCGESSMWGDYHLLELGVYLQRLLRGGTYLTFFDS